MLRLEDVLGGKPGTLADATFRAMWSMDFNVESAFKRHYFRKSLLARYGRQSVLQWGDTPVTEMEEYVEQIMDLVKRENALGASEDNG